MIGRRDSRPPGPDRPGKTPVICGLLLPLLLGMVIGLTIDGGMDGRDTLGEIRTLLGPLPTALGRLWPILFNLALLILPMILAHVVMVTRSRLVAAIRAGRIVEDSGGNLRARTGTATAIVAICLVLAAAMLTFLVVNEYGTLLHRGVDYVRSLRG